MIREDQNNKKGETMGDKWENRTKGTVDGN